MRLPSLLLMILLISGCKEKQTVTPVSENEQLPKANSPKQLDVEKVGELRFRKSYAGHENMTDKEYGELRKSNPEYYYASSPDSFLLKRFNALGYLNDDYDLQSEKLNSFKLFDVEKPDTTFYLIDDLDEKVSCQIKKADSSYMFNLFIAGNAQGVLLKIKNKFILPGLQLKTLDVIAGGFEEIILLDAYYIINGDNFDFFIYEIKYN
jgi:hypothetical protein